MHHSSLVFYLLFLVLFFFFFFFSSRRRHTRSLRDWSSDVCSSDLIRSSGIRYICGGFPPFPEGCPNRSGGPCWISPGRRCTPPVWVFRTRERERSEEHTSELQSRRDLVCRLLLEKKKRQGQIRALL